MAHKLLVPYPPPADPGRFPDHCARVHLPLVAALPGLRASRHSYATGGVQTVHYPVSDPAPR